MSFTDIFSPDKTTFADAAAADAAAADAAAVSAGDCSSLACMLSPAVQGDRLMSHHLTEEQLQPLHISMQVMLASFPPPSFSFHFVFFLLMRIDRRTFFSLLKKFSRVQSVRGSPPHPTCRGMKLAL
jgi:hypothetical protein